MVTLTISLCVTASTEMCIFDRYELISVHSSFLTGWMGFSSDIFMTIMGTKTLMHMSGKQWNGMGMLRNGMVILPYYCCNDIKFNILQAMIYRQRGFQRSVVSAAASIIGTCWNALALESASSIRASIYSKVFAEPLKAIYLKNWRKQRDLKLFHGSDDPEYTLTREYSLAKP